MKNWMIFGIGLVAGAGIGVLGVRNHYKKLAFDEINEARDVFRKMAASKEAAVRNSEMKLKMVSDIPENTEKEGSNDEKLVKLVQKSEKKADLDRLSELTEPYNGEKTGKTGTKKNYNVFSNPPKIDEIDISDEEEEENEDDPYEITVDHEHPSDGYSEPYEITEEEFASEKLFYDKVMIEYYTDGVAVLEESEQIIDCIEDLIGPDILQGKLDRMSKWEGDEFYVRNDNRSSDYGIRFTGEAFVPEEGLN